MDWLWEAIIVTKFGNVKVSVRAPTQHAARILLEAQYGSGSILGNEVNQA